MAALARARSGLGCRRLAGRARPVALGGHEPVLVRPRSHVRHAGSLRARRPRGNSFAARSTPRFGRPELGRSRPRLGIEPVLPAAAERLSCVQPPGACGRGRDRRDRRGARSRRRARSSSSALRRRLRTSRRSSSWRRRAHVGAHRRRPLERPRHRDGAPRGPAAHRRRGADDRRRRRPTSGPAARRADDRARATRGSSTSARASTATGPTAQPDRLRREPRRRAGARYRRRGEGRLRLRPRGVATRPALLRHPRCGAPRRRAPRLPVEHYTGHQIGVSPERPAAARALRRDRPAGREWCFAIEPGVYAGRRSALRRPRRAHGAR